MNNLQSTSNHLQFNAAKESKIVNRKPEIENRVAWLSLDEGDNDPARFLAYLITALQTIAANIGEGVLPVLQTPQPPPDRINFDRPCSMKSQLSQINFVLILDDYHVIDAKPVDHALSISARAPTAADAPGHCHP